MPACLSAAKVVAARDWAPRAIRRPDTQRARAPSLHRHSFRAAARAAGTRSQSRRRRPAAARQGRSSRLRLRRSQTES
eukprot:11209263-Lingulodinium_polyedra.AAC.1